MPGFLEPIKGNDVTSTQVPWRAQRALAQLQSENLVRRARVMSESSIASEKILGLQSASREAVMSYSLLAKYRDVAAAGDPLLADELSQITNIARLGMAEVIAELSATYCREGRR